MEPEPTNTLDVQDIRNWFAITSHERPDLDDAGLVYLCALAILRHYLGVPWVDANVNPSLSKVPRPHRPGRAFLRTAGASIEDRLRHQERLTTLAELCFELQGVEGVAERLVAITSGTVESTVAELEFARYFHSRGMGVKFKPTSTDKGVQSFDMFVTLLPGVDVPCEVKCNLEDTPLGENTVFNTLKGAQIPAGSRGIICVKMPQRWAETRDFHKQIEVPTWDFLRQNRRTWMVLHCWQETRAMPDGTGMTSFPAKVFANPQVPEASEVVRPIAESLLSPDYTTLDLRSMAENAMTSWSFVVLPETTSEAQPEVAG